MAALLLLSACSSPAPAFDRVAFDREYPEMRDGVRTLPEYEALLRQPRGCGRGERIQMYRIHAGDCLHFGIGDITYSHLANQESGRRLDDVLAELESCTCVAVRVAVEMASLPDILIFGALEGGPVRLGCTGFRRLSELLAGVHLKKSANPRQILVLRSPFVSPQLGVRAIVCDLDSGDDPAVAPGEAIYVPDRWSIGPGLQERVMGFLRNGDWEADLPMLGR